LEDLRLAGGFAAVLAAGGSGCRAPPRLLAWPTAYRAKEAPTVHPAAVLAAETACVPLEAADETATSSHCCRLQRRQWRALTQPQRAQLQRHAPRS